MNVPPMPDEAARAASDPANLYDRYVAVSLLGRGGFGAVWRAWDPGLGRWIALKVLQGGDARDLARFQREARMAGALDHPGIVPVYDVGEARGHHFIAMKLIEGQPAHEAGLSPAEAIDAGRQAAEALAAAHDRGIVHRDIKPGNLLVRRESGGVRAYVTDFGLARPLDGPSAVSVTGDIVGTIPFMSPEQAAGQTERIGPATDQWSLAVTLYLLLTDRLPFQGAGMADTIEKIAREEPAAIANAPPRLDHAVRRALAKDPAARWPGLRDFAAELEGCRRDWMSSADAATLRAPVAAAVPKAPPPPPVRQAPRIGLWIAVAAITVAVPALGLGGWLLLRPGPDPTPPAPEPTPGPPVHAEDDYGDDAASAHAISVPGRIEGRLGPEDADWFSFEARAGWTFTARITTDRRPVVLHAFSTAAQTLGRTLPNGLADWTCPSEGTYYLIVRNVSPRPGSYTLDLSSTAPPVSGPTTADDHADGIDGATVLSIESVVRGEIGAAGDADVFRFSAPGRARYDILVERLTLPGATTEILDASGTVVARGAPEAQGVRILWQCPATAAYYVRIRAGEPGQTGTYRLHFGLQ